MIKIKRLTSVFLVLIMLFCTVSAISCSTNVTYTVNVKTPDGTPISGMKVQLCFDGDQLDEGSTNSKGVASFEAKKRNGYYATITVPEDYKPNPIKYGFGKGSSVDIIMDKKPVDILNVTYTVTVKNTDGDPLSGVELKIFSGENVIDTVISTDANGVASFTAPEGNYTVNVTAPEGYIADTTAYSFDTSNTLVIKLQKQEIQPPPVVPVDYTVKVQASDGTALSGVIVFLKKDGETVQSLTTDSNGFVVFSQPEGTYTITVTTPEGYIADTTAYSFDASNTLIIELQKQEIQPPPVVPVDYTVKVQASDGTALSGVLVFLKKDGETVEYLRTDSNGSAVFSQPEGSYTVTVSAPEGYVSSSDGYTFNSERVAVVALSTRVSANGFEGNGTEALPFVVGTSGKYTEHHEGGDSYLWFSFEFPANGILTVKVPNGVSLWFDGNASANAEESLRGWTDMKVVFGIANTDYSAGDISFELEFTPDSYHVVDTFENGEGTYGTPYVIEAASTYTVSYAGGDTYVYFVYTLPTNGEITVEILTPDGDAALWLDGERINGNVGTCKAYADADILFGIGTDSYNASDITFRITFSSSQL